jgi:hypothetical protein
LKKKKDDDIQNLTFEVFSNSCTKDFRPSALNLVFLCHQDTWDKEPQDHPKYWVLNLEPTDYLDSVNHHPDKQRSPAHSDLTLSNSIVWIFGFYRGFYSPVPKRAITVNLERCFPWSSSKFHRVNDMSFQIRWLSSRFN